MLNPFPYIPAVPKYQAELLVWIKELPFDSNVGLCQKYQRQKPGYRKRDC